MDGYANETDVEILKCFSHVTLKGPHHPLETNLTCIHRLGSTKRVKIEQVS